MEGSCFQLILQVPNYGERVAEVERLVAAFAPCGVKSHLNAAVLAQCFYLSDSWNDAFRSFGRGAAILLPAPRVGAHGVEAAPGAPV